MIIKIVILGVLLLLVIVCMYLYFGTTILEVSNHKIESGKLPKSFDGYKIAHISDFHNTKSNKIKNKIIKSLEKNKPDILIITGDLIDSRRTNMKVSLEFIKKIKNIPIYYVAGNHESRIKDYPNFKENLKKLGVNVLENERVKLSKNKSNIYLIGLQDPTFETEERNTDEMKIIVNSYLEDLASEKDFDILLLHRPELFDIYVQNHVDLTFSGHAHGGQFIVPFVGPLFAPNQGCFPKLTSGVHEKNNMNLVISRGIGNSSMPVRINNNPELIFVTLKHK